MGSVKQTRVIDTIGAKVAIGAIGLVGTRSECEAERRHMSHRIHRSQGHMLRRRTG